MRFPNSTASLLLLASLSIAGCAHFGRDDHKEYWRFQIEESPAETFVYLHSVAGLGKPNIAIEGSDDSSTLVADLRAIVQERIVLTAKYDGHVWMTDDNGVPELKQVSFVEKGNERNPEVPKSEHDKAKPGEVVRDLPEAEYPVSVEWAIVPVGLGEGDVTDSWVDANAMKFGPAESGDGEELRRRMRGMATPIVPDAKSGARFPTTHQIRISGGDLAYIRDKVKLDGAQLMLVVKAKCDRTEGVSVKPSSWHELKPFVTQLMSETK